MSIIFDGTSVKYGTFPNEALFHNATAFSLIVWFKPVGGVTQQHLIGADQNAGGSTRYSGIYYRGNASGVAAFTKSSVEAHYNIATPTLDQWSVAIVSRPTGATAQTTPMALNATDTSASTLTNGSSDLARFIIGARRIAGGSTYTDLANAKIGGFAIYQRQLTSGEIDQYQAGDHPDDVGGFTDYMMFSGSGTATTQLSQNGRTMTFVGSPALDTDTPFPAQTITSINSGAGVKIGSTGNIAATSGFASAPTTVTIGSLTGTVTAYNSGTGDTTFTVPAPTHEASYPDIDSTQTVTLSNGGGETASLAGVPFEPPTGSTAITVAAPVTDDSRYLGYWMLDIFGVTAANGDKYYGIDADVTWAADTGGSAVSLPVTTPVVYWDASTGIAYLLVVTVNPDGIVTNGITARGLTAVGMTVTGLTAIGV
jgi:hypothetical protein